MHLFLLHIAQHLLGWAGQREQVTEKSLRQARTAGASCLTGRDSQVLWGLEREHRIRDVFWLGLQAPTGGSPGKWGQCTQRCGVNMEIREVRSGVGKVPEKATEQGGPRLPLTSSPHHLLLCPTRSRFLHYCLKTNQYGAAWPDLPNAQTLRERNMLGEQPREGRNAQERCRPSAWGWHRTAPGKTQRQHQFF